MQGAFEACELPVPNRDHLRSRIHVTAVIAEEVLTQRNPLLFADVRVHIGTSGERTRRRRRKQDARQITRKTRTIDDELTDQDIDILQEWIDETIATLNPSEPEPSNQASLDDSSERS